MRIVKAPPQKKTLLEMLFFCLRKKTGSLFPLFPGGGGTLFQAPFYFPDFGKIYFGGQIFFFFTGGPFLKKLGEFLKPRNGGGTPRPCYLSVALPQKKFLGLFSSKKKPRCE